MRINYRPWFYYWYWYTMKFGGYIWDHMGTPAPSPRNLYGTIYAAIMQGCRQCEIDAGVPVSGPDHRL